MAVVAPGEFFEENNQKEWLTSQQLKLKGEPQRTSHRALKRHPSPAGDKQDPSQDSMMKVMGSQEGETQPHWGCSFKATNKGDFVHWKHSCGVHHRTPGDGRVSARPAPMLRESMRACVKQGRDNGIALGMVRSS